MRLEDPLLRRIITWVIILGVPLALLDGWDLWQASEQGKWWGTGAWVRLIALGMFVALFAGVVAGLIEHFLILKLTKNRRGGPNPVEK